MIASEFTALRCALSALALLLSACEVPPDDEDTRRADGTSSRTAEEACLDMAHVVADSAERCGFDYRANHAAFVEAASGGDCANIQRVRDIASLYDDCIPFLSSLPCSKIDNPDLQMPKSCKDQLER